MRIQLTLSAIVAAVTVALVACESNKVSQSSGGDIVGAMRGMATSLEKLLPYVFSREEFKDDKNASKIRELMSDFSVRTQKVPEHIGEALLGKDPLVKYSISRLRTNAEQSMRAFDDGHKEFARGTLRESVTACFNCHSTSQFGPQNNFDTAKLDGNFRMSTSEKADFYVATRQFDKAVNLLESVLQSPMDFYDNPHEQVMALKKYLSLEVRVKQDPMRAAGTVEKFLSQRKLPYFLSMDAESWLKSLRRLSTAAKTVENPLAEAKELLRQAERSQLSTGFQTGLVENLRATSLLHEALRSATKDQTRAEIYHLLGASYDSLSDLGLWDLPEVYFEACVRIIPNSNTAKKCYKSFERSIILGFSGSAGIFIPNEERAKLTELRELSGLK